MDVDKLSILSKIGLLVAIISGVINGFSEGKFFAILTLIGVLCSVPFAIWLLFMYFKLIYELISNGKILRALVIIFITVFPSIAFWILRMYIALALILLFFFSIGSMFIHHK